MSRSVPVEKATGADVCTICGQPIHVGDDVLDIYGDLYHVLCMKGQSTDGATEEYGEYDATSEALDGLIRGGRCET